MCAYKLCTVEFKWLGLQGKVEKFIQNVKPYFILKKIHHIKILKHILYCIV